MVGTGDANPYCHADLSCAPKLTHANQRPTRPHDMAGPATAAGGKMTKDSAIHASAVTRGRAVSQLTGESVCRRKKVR